MQLAIHGGSAIASPEEAGFEWPRITREVEAAVSQQLHESLSIYDRSGIFAKFEDSFSSYFGRRYGLLSNSGTSAILAMFEGIGPRSHTEVLCPVYTFHASVSPLTYLGLTPVFCDADDAGNITLEEIQRRRTDRTSAVVITHMWGMPVADSHAIGEYCKAEGLDLLEDCSHAHGAEINGRKVGTFGTAAAWSLQGQKIITGGEGGVLLTDRQDVYERALLQGHYNKRPLKEMRPDAPLREYYLTGMGLKLRAHPLAIVIAYQQFQLLEDFRATKQRFADMMTSALSGYDFLVPPRSPDSHQPSWYAYNLKFDSSHAHEVTRERFVEALHAEGLVEADIPGSTGLLHTLPLFTRPEGILGRLYSKGMGGQGSEEFPAAASFYNSIIKFPVWAFEDEEPIVRRYIDGITKVADYVASYGKL